MEEQEEQVIDVQPETNGIRRFPRARLCWGAVSIVSIALIVVGVWLWTSGAWRGWRAVAKVDGVRITRNELEEHLAFLVKQERVPPEILADPVRKRELERFAVDDLITRRFVQAEAKRLKVVVEPGEEDMVFGKAHGAQWGQSELVETAKKRGEAVTRLRQEVRAQLLVKRLREKLTEAISVSDEDAIQYYERNQQAFVIPAMAHLRVLIIESRAEAERLRGQAVKGGDFAAIVQQNSKGGAKESGGDMGWVDPRMLPVPIAAAVEAISQTGFTPVLEAGGRFYVVRVEGRQGPRQIPLAEVREQIKERLTAERKQAKFAEWVQKQRLAAKVEVYL